MNKHNNNTIQSYYAYTNSYINIKFKWLPGHAIHWAEPTLFANEPAWHCEQVDDGGIVDDWPIAQSVQADAEDNEYEPGALIHTDRTHSC